MRVICKASFQVLQTIQGFVELMWLGGFLKANVKTLTCIWEGPSVFYMPPAVISMHWTVPVV